MLYLRDNEATKSFFCSFPTKLGLLQSSNWFLLPHRVDVKHASTSFTIIPLTRNRTKPTKPAWAARLGQEAFFDWVVEPKFGRKTWSRSKGGQSEYFLLGFFNPCLFWFAHLKKDEWVFCWKSVFLKWKVKCFVSEKGEGNTSTPPKQIAPFWKKRIKISQNYDMFWELSSSPQNISILN